MKIFFAGTPEIAVKSLEAIAGQFEICGVLTNPDKPSGRKGIIKPSPVKEKALTLGLRVFQPERLDSEFLSEVANLAPDVLVTFAYGKIFKKDFLSLFRKEALNIHPSLLPRHRGPSPLNAAILSGDKETGISIQRMALRMDSGDIIRQERFPLSGDENLKVLSEIVSGKSASIIVEVLSDIVSGNYSAKPQEESLATYCRLVGKDDGLIDWNETSVQIERKFRAYYQWPGIFTYWNDRLLVFTGCHIPQGQVNIANLEDMLPGTVAGVDRKEGILVKTGDGVIAVTGIKPQSRNEMDFKSFLNGTRDFTGSRLAGTIKT